MKVVVCFENQGERKFARKIAGLIRALMAKQKHANVVVEVEHRDRFAPYRNNAELLALEAKRLMDAQEAAFGENDGWQDLGHMGEPMYDDVLLSQQKVVKSWGGQVVRTIQAGTPRGSVDPRRKAQYTIEQLNKLRQVLSAAPMPVMPNPVQPFVFGDPVDRSGATGPDGKTSFEEYYKLNGKKP